MFHLLFHLATPLLASLLSSSVLEPDLYAHTHMCTILSVHTLVRIPTCITLQRLSPTPNYGIVLIQPIMRTEDKVVACAPLRQPADQVATEQKSLMTSHLTVMIPPRRP